MQTEMVHGSASQWIVLREHDGEKTCFQVVEASANVDVISERSLVIYIRIRSK